MEILAYLVQVPNEPQAGQIERILNRLLDGGEGAYVIILLAILAGVLFAVYKVFVPFIKAAQEAIVTFTAAAKDQRAVTERVADGLELNNQHTERTLRVSEEVAKVALNTSIAVDTTASKIDTVDTKITQITTDVGRALTEIAALRAEIGANNTANSQIMAKIDTLALQMATALTDLRDIKSDLATVAAPPQSTPTPVDTRTDDNEAKG